MNNQLFRIMNHWALESILPVRFLPWKKMVKTGFSTFWQKHANPALDKA